MNRKVVYLIISVFVATGCASKWGTGHTVVYGLAKGASASFNDAVITVADIKESRCPMNARCIRAGEAIAQFTIHHKQKTAAFALCTGADCKQTQKDSKALITFDGTQYEFDLKEITPDPTLTLKKQEPKVVFSVKKTG